VKTAQQEQSIRTYHRTLYRLWGPQHWWPARTRFGVIVGAYLTQNTAWTNVDRALRHLRASGRLTLQGIRRTPLSQLEALIRPAGYFRQKAQRLETFVAFLDQHYAGSLNRMFSQPTAKLREELLALNGVGPETADSILLYAGNRPVFVVDAYTRRILARHNLLPEKADYEEIRALFERALANVARAPWPANPAPTQPASAASQLRGAAHFPSPMSTAKRTATVQIYNEMHGLIVRVGKHYCLKSKPLCEQCPLQPFLPSKPLK
jgi:endonuclease III related protein